MVVRRWRLFMPALHSRCGHYIYEPQSRFARLWLDMIIALSDAHNFDAALNNYGLQPVGPRSVEAFQRTDVDSTDYDLLLVEPRSVQRSHNCAEVAHAHTSPPDAQL